MAMRGKYDSAIMRFVLMFWLIVGPLTLIKGGGVVSAAAYTGVWGGLVLSIINDLVDCYKQHGSEEVMPLDKRILSDYIDACAQAKETKEVLQKLQKAKKRRELDAVKGSSHEFPYTMQTYHLDGLAYAVVMDPGQEERLEETLRERLRNAERIKHDVEAWLNTIPQRMQRIIRYKIFEELTWKEVAERMGRKTTELSVKKEYQRFMEI